MMSCSASSSSTLEEALPADMNGLKEEMDENENVLSSEIEIKNKLERKLKPLYKSHEPLILSSIRYFRMQPMDLYRVCI